MSAEQEIILELYKRLEEINSLVFAESIILGSDKYFQVRDLCTKHLREDLFRGQTKQS